MENIKKIEVNDYEKGGTNIAAVVIIIGIMAIMFATIAYAFLGM